MYLRHDSVFCSLAQYPVCFLYCEEPFVAEHVHIVCQTFCRNSRQHLLANKVNIFALASFVSSSYRMSTQEVRLYGYRSCLLDTLYDTKHLELILDCQTVSALYLDGTCTHRHDLVDPFHSLSVQLFLRGFVQQVCGIKYSTSASRNLLI